MAKGKDKWWLNPSGPRHSAPHRVTAGSAKPTKPRMVVAPDILEQSAKDYRDLLTALSNKRQIMRGSTSASLVFQAVDGKVIATGLQMKFSDIFYTWTTREFEYDQPHITVSSGFATEAQLLQARSMVPAAEAGKIDVLIKIVRDGVTPPAPIRVEITNADQLQRDTILSIKRGDDGKISGAVAMKT